MQNRSKKYADAMVEILKIAEGEDEIKKKAQKLKSLLEKRGDIKLTGDILREFYKGWKTRNGQIAKLITAKKMPEKSVRQIKTGVESKGYILEEMVEPDLIGGAKLFLGNHYLIDSSFKGKLLRLEKVIQSSKDDQ